MVQQGALCTCLLPCFRYGYLAEGVHTLTYTQFFYVYCSAGLIYIVIG